MEGISIIIPAYNASVTLRKSILSCLNQTLLPLEIIIVNDGSQDETEQIAALFEQSTRYFYLKNGGVSYARNYGASWASGDWLLFLDADDQLLPHALERLLETAEQEQAGVAYGMVLERREPPHQARLNGFDYAAGEPPAGSKRLFWRNAIITPGSAIVRATLHRKIHGFVSGYEPMEDRDYWIKCGLVEPIAFCDTVVLDKIWQPSSHGSQEKKRIFRGQIAQRALKKWAQERNISTNWMPSDLEIVTAAINEALWRRHDDLLEPLLEEANSLGFSRFSHWKALLTLLITRRALRFKILESLLKRGSC